MLMHLVLYISFVIDIFNAFNSLICQNITNRMFIIFFYGHWLSRTINGFGRFEVGCTVAYSYSDILKLDQRNYSMCN